jgi:prephenate dehydrogenase
VRDVVAQGDRDALLGQLERAREARRKLPAAVSPAAELVELRVLVPDEPGTLATVTTLASELGTNILDIEIAHSSEGDRGVLILVIAADQVARFHDALGQRGFTSSWSAFT